jgi:hypothetical protein
VRFRLYWLVLFLLPTTLLGSQETALSGPSTYGGALIYPDGSPNRRTVILLFTRVPISTTEISRW